MTRGEVRKARKAAREAGESWAVEHEDGRTVVVRTRTEREERAHERRMDRWARRIDSDPDWR